MASLTDLPVEILIIIINKLDTDAIYNLYNTCRHMKNIITMYGVIRVCNLSLNTLATAKSLQLGMIKNVMGYLQELNMCGVPNLTRCVLLTAIKKMKCLQTLNVAYTKINIIDVIDLYKNCPTIKNITINFQFPNHYISTVPIEMLEPCQEVFKHFVNVHFVLRSLLTNLPMYILKKSVLNTLTYTVHDWKGAVFKRENVESVPFNHFSIFLLNWQDQECYQNYTEYLPLVELEDVEFIIIEYDNTYSLNTSSMFTKFFSENFCKNSFADLESQKTVYGNIAIFMWNKQTTVFDELFFSKLKKRLKQILVCELEVSKEVPMSLNITPDNYDWVYVNHIQRDFKTNRGEDLEPIFKRIRTVPNTQLLNYDKIFYNYNNVKLNIFFTNPGIVTLSASNEYLRKLTHLSLKGPVVRYSSEFFNTLFRSCDKLITLNVEAPAVFPCCPSIFRSIPLSQSVKNIRLVDKRIDFNMLFSSFSQCKTLENICVVDISTDPNSLADPTTLFKKCNNLYNLFIQAELGTLATVRKLQYKLNTAKKNCLMDYLNLTLCNCQVLQTYNPYLHVFNLRPIKPV